MEDNASLQFQLSVLWDAAHSTEQIRHAIFHYKPNNNTIFNAFNTIEKSSAQSKPLLEKDIAGLQNAFKEQLRSTGIADYYTTEMLLTCFANMQFYLYAPQYPLTPSFRNVFKKGANLQQACKDKLSWYQSAEKGSADKERQPLTAYKNLLQWIYYHAFLPEVFSNHNESLITNFFQTTKKWNQGQPNNKKYRYEAMPDYAGEGLLAYMQNLQSVQIKQATDVHEKKAVNNHFITFIQDTIVFAFNSYLSSKLGAQKDELQKPTKQDDDSNVAVEKLFENDARKPKMCCKFFKSAADVDNEVVPFYLFLRLLDMRELNKLRNQFMRYRCSLQSRAQVKQQFSTNDIEKLEELIALVCFTQPQHIEPENFKTFLAKNFKDFIEGDASQYPELYTQTDQETAIHHKHMTLLARSGVLPLYKEILGKGHATTQKGKEYVVTKDDFERYQKWTNREDGASIIEKQQKELADLHQTLVKIIPQKSKKTNKYYLTKKEDIQRYESLAKEVQEYNALHRKVTFESMYTLYRMHVDILARFVGFAQDWERDMFFILTALKHRGIIDVDVNELFGDGCVVKKISDALKIEDKRFLLKLFWRDSADEVNQVQATGKYKEGLYNRFAVRNPIAHLNSLSYQRTGVRSIEDQINSVRLLLAYDRKRQNSVTKSIRELLSKEYKLDIRWKNDEKRQDKKKVALKIHSIQDVCQTHLRNLQCINPHKNDTKNYIGEAKWMREAVQISTHGEDMKDWVEQILKYCYTKTNK